MRDLSAHTMNQLVEIGYDPWLIVKPGSKKAFELISILKSGKFIVSKQIGTSKKIRRKREASTVRQVKKATVKVIEKPEFSNFNIREKNKKMYTHFDSFSKK